MVTPSLRPFRAAILWLLILTSSGGSLLAQLNESRFVFVNTTGLPDDAIFVTLQGAAVASGITDGSGQSISQNISYSLAEIMGTVPNAGSGGPVGSVPTISMSAFNTGAVMNITLGQKIGAATPSSSIVSGRLEVFADTNSTSNNVDISYVDGISLPMSFSIKQRANGSLVPLSNQLNQVNTTFGSTIFNKLTANASVTPSSARVQANYNVVNSTGASVGTMTGIASIVSPQLNSDYHSWVSPNTGVRATSALVPWLRSQGTQLKLQSFQVPNGDTMGNVLFGFSTVTPGAGAYSPFTTDDPTNKFLQGQSYDLTATFVSDLNPASNPLLNAQGITQGTAGVKISGTGDVTGAFDVYITDAQLSLSSATYGSNPEYVVKWDGGVNGPTAVTTYNTNSLVDRVVGDLTAGINMGWADSQTIIGTHATDTGTINNLTNTVFEAGNPLNSAAIGSLGSGEFFYLLSLQGNTTDIAKWFGGSIEDNELFYNTYGSAFAADTNAYTLAFSDRLQGISNPDIYYFPGDATVPLEDLYMEITLGPGGYTFVGVPEPSTLAFIGLGGGLVLLLARCRKKV